MMDDIRITQVRLKDSLATRNRFAFRTTTIIVIALAVLLATAMLISVAGCGSKAGISQSQYDQVQKGMTLDEVEGLLGQPDRTHRTGSTSNPNIIWYYNKSEAEGLVRVSFIDAKVDNLSPYDLSVNLDE